MDGWVTKQATALNDAQARSAPSGRRLAGTATGIARDIVPDPAYSKSEGTTVMNSIIYMVGLVVIVLAILSFVGLA
ncbi:MAG: hypothetical protein WD715_09840 [Dongiaceae bacterium]